MNASTRSSSPSTWARAASRAAGSSQSVSSAAFKLEAASCGTPARSAIMAVPAACPRPCTTAITPRALRRACPIKLKVSSTRPAPHSGDESSAARSARAPNSPVAAASSTVRSTSRRSRLRSISRLRNPTKVPLENSGSSAPRQAGLADMGTGRARCQPDDPLEVVRLVERDEVRAVGYDEVLAGAAYLADQPALDCRLQVHRRLVEDRDPARRGAAQQRAQDDGFLH